MFSFSHMLKFLGLIGFGLAASAYGKHVMLMNRIGPSESELYVSNLNGSDERKLLPDSGFDYHASFSYDGTWVVFTSERAGYGQADVYRAHSDGTGMERLTDDPALDDQGVLSPDSTQLAFVSTRATHRPNIWILNLKTLTSGPGLKPSFSNDGVLLVTNKDVDSSVVTMNADGSNKTSYTKRLTVLLLHRTGRPTGSRFSSGLEVF